MDLVLSQGKRAQGFVHAAISQGMLSWGNHNAMANEALLQCMVFACRIYTGTEASVLSSLLEVHKALDELAAANEPGQWPLLHHLHLVALQSSSR